MDHRDFELTTRGILQVPHGILQVPHGILQVPHGILQLPRDCLNIILSYLCAPYLAALRRVDKEMARAVDAFMKRAPAKRICCAEEFIECTRAGHTYCLREFTGINRSTFKCRVSGLVVNKPYENCVCDWHPACARALSERITVFSAALTFKHIAMALMLAGRFYMAPRVCAAILYITTVWPRCYASKTTSGIVRKCIVAALIAANSNRARRLHLIRVYAAGYARNAKVRADTVAMFINEIMRGVPNMELEDYRALLRCTSLGDQNTCFDMSLVMARFADATNAKDIAGAIYEENLVYGVLALYGCQAALDNRALMSHITDTLFRKRGVTEIVSVIRDPGVLIYMIDVRPAWDDDELACLISAENYPRTERTTVIDHVATKFARRAQKIAATITNKTISAYFLQRATNVIGEATNVIGEATNVCDEKAVE
jgi:hypothetical protein